LPPAPLFQSFFLGGFECSTHRLASGRRLDMIAATRHDRHAAADYARLRQIGIRSAREGIRWHLIEPTPNRFDFSSVRPMLRAAREAGIQVIWDVMHYGWPDDVDIFSPEFIGRFARLARRFARFLADEGELTPWIVPINEISFLSWTGGEVGQINPFARSRGFELKIQLVLASLAAIREVRDVIPTARFAQVEPIFHVIADPDRPDEAPAAEAYRLAQYQAWDMLSGRLLPELGGRPEDLDVIGVNYYPWNQWTYQGPSEPGANIGPDHEAYRPFREMLRENFDRYRRPLLVAETGTEGTNGRPGSVGSATRSTPPSSPGPGSSASASTRSSISPAGTTTATVKTASGTTPTRPETVRSMPPWHSNWPASNFGSIGSSGLDREGLISTSTPHGRAEPSRVFPAPPGPLTPSGEAISVESGPEEARGAARERVGPEEAQDLGRPLEQAALEGEEPGLAPTVAG